MNKSDDKHAYFDFEGRKYRVPIVEAREICYMNSGLIKLPNGTLLGVDICATPINPIYIIDTVVEYDGQDWLNPNMVIEAEEVPNPPF